MPAPAPVAALDAWIEPVEVFTALASAPGLFWLDAGAGAEAGWSWVGVGTPDTPDAVRAVACQASVGEGPVGAAGPLAAGWIGWWAYDDGARRAGAPATPSAQPAAAWLRIGRMLAFDHGARRVWAVGAGAAALAAPQAYRGPRTAAGPIARVARARHSAEAYADLVERCRDAIREGDAYQLCLTTRFEVDGPVDDVTTYLSLRASSPSHHGGFIRHGGTTLVSASPERFLEVAGGVVRTSPIKGTRPRGDTAAEDERQIAELLGSPKERAENVMIVDLMRNDLSRVSLPGTVAVERLLAVESYPAVHQLVSTVAGSLRAGTTIGALLDATFPAGSMTGAPKLSAMTILAELERGARGVYAGCFGWVGDDGRADLAMTIRTVVVHAEGAYVGSGGGITWGSVPAAEVAEVGLKAAAPLAALGAALPPGW